MSWRWLTVADTSSAVGRNAADEPLIVWTLGWARTALLNHPGQPFDAPINYPARLQLAGSEHLLSSQLLFLPLQTLVGNHFLAADLTRFVTYPLASLAMQRLLLLAGHTGYQPPHRGVLVRHLMAGNRETFQDIIDMTGLRWVLLRPDMDWDGGRNVQRETLMAATDLTLRDSYQGWDLLEVGLRPRHERCRGYSQRDRCCDDAPRHTTRED